MVAYSDVEIGCSNYNSTFALLRILFAAESGFPFLHLIWVLVVKSSPLVLSVYRVTADCFYIEKFHQKFHEYTRRTGAFVFLDPEK